MGTILLQSCEYVRRGWGRGTPGPYHSHLKVRVECSPVLILTIQGSVVRITECVLPPMQDRHGPLPFSLVFMACLELSGQHCQFEL